MLKTLEELDSYAWTGHAGVLGMHLQRWRAVKEVLRHFGNKLPPARHCYRQYIADGLNNEPMQKYSGGGLIRSYDGWEAPSKSQ